MQMNLAFHEIISWIITAVSVSLFVYERKKNNLTPFYMNLQGLLKTCHAKTVFYWQVATQSEELDKPSEKFKWLAVSNDFEALKQTIMGVMKAIEPNKDMPFNDRDYTTIKEPNKS
jgi:hypothetical protein